MEISRRHLQVEGGGVRPFLAENRCRQRQVEPVCEESHDLRRAVPPTSPTRGAKTTAARSPYLSCENQFLLRSSPRLPVSDASRIPIWPLPPSGFAAAVSSCDFSPCLCSTRRL